MTPVHRTLKVVDTPGGLRRLPTSCSCQDQWLITWGAAPCGHVFDTIFVGRNAEGAAEIAWLNQIKHRLKPRGKLIVAGRRIA